jgi:hypothetical protein
MDGDHLLTKRKSIAMYPQNMYSGPYPDVAKYFALKHIPNIQSDISEYVEIFAQYAGVLGVHYNNEWWGNDRSESQW